MEKGQEKSKLVAECEAERNRIIFLNQVLEYQKYIINKKLITEKLATEN